MSVNSSNFAEDSNYWETTVHPAKSWAEIEEMLREHPEIMQVAVVGVPDERMGEVGMAFIVAVPGARLTPESVIAWSREHIANYKVPRFVRLVSELPVNAMGKVTKYVLRELANEPE